MDLDVFKSLAARMRPAISASDARWLADAPRGCDAPDDIVQDTLLRLWTLRDRLDGYRSPDAVVMVTARHVALDAIRRIGARPSQALEEGLSALDDAPAADDMLDTSLAEQLASLLLGRLPDRQALVVKMRHADGLEFDEIAAMTGMSEGNVRTLLSRGRARLRELYLNSTNEAI